MPAKRLSLRAVTVESSVHREISPVRRRIEEETTKTVPWVRETLQARTAATLAAVDALLAAFETGRDPTPAEWRAAMAATRTLARRLDETRPACDECRRSPTDSPDGSR